MPKRSYEEKIDRYKKKMKKLRDKHRHKRRRLDNSISSSDQDDPNNTEGSPNGMWDVGEPDPVPTMDQQNDPTPALAPPESVQILDDSSFPPLDSEILSALGEATDQGPTWGQDIHYNLTQLWQPLLKKGMAKENKDKVIKQYLIPSNCTLLQAPKLNIDISAAILEMVRLRDKKVESTQQQLGVGITTISRAMTSLLTSDDKVEVIKTLSDGCRILCDLHYSETQARIKMITPGLAKPFLNVIQDSERDETLFGRTLPEKIKASRTIEKQGLQIKNNTKSARPHPVVAQNTMPARQQFQGNWAGPPRYPSSRGGARRTEETHIFASNSSGNCDVGAIQSESGPVTCPNTQLIKTSTSAAPDAYPGSSAALGRAFSRRGAPPTTLRLMLASLPDKSSDVATSMEGNTTDPGADESTDQGQIAPLLTLYVFVSIVGIIGNLSLMAALASGGASRLRTPQLLSSCAADLLVCAASAPLAATRAARLHHLPCVVTYYIESFPVAASTFSLVAIAADRCGTVRRGRGAPLCARPALTIAAVWLTAVLLGTAAAIAPCAACPMLAAAHAVVTYCVPVAVIARCHWAVHMKLTALSLTARAAHGELPLPVPMIHRPTHVIIVAGVGPRERRDAVDVGDTRSKKLQPSLLGPQPQTSTLRSRRRLGNVLIGIAAIFAACWCPHAAIVIAGAFGIQAPLALAQYALLLGHAHSALNAAAYWALNRHALTAACSTWRLPQLRVREERPSSTNEAALGAFHPRLARPAPSPRPPPSSFLY